MTLPHSSRRSVTSRGPSRAFSRRTRSRRSRAGSAERSRWGVEGAWPRRGLTGESASMWTQGVVSTLRSERRSSSSSLSAAVGPRAPAWVPAERRSGLAREASTRRDEVGRESGRRSGRGSGLGADESNAERFEAERSLPLKDEKRDRKGMASPRACHGKNNESSAGCAECGRVVSQGVHGALARAAGVCERVDSGGSGKRQCGPRARTSWAKSLSRVALAAQTRRWSPRRGPLVAGLEGGGVDPTVSRGSC